MVATDIKNKVNIVDIVGKYIKLIKKGTNNYALCPFHDDHNPSLQVSEGRQCFKCFSCGVGGDVIEFVKKIENVSFIKALKIIETSSFGDFSPIKNEVIKHKNKVIEYEDIYPITSEMMKTIPTHYRKKPIVNYYKYYNKNSDLIGFTVRVVDKDNNKKVIPLKYAIVKTDGNEIRKWVFKLFNSGHTIYGNELLYVGKDSLSQKLIIIVEGEKCVDVGNKLFGGRDIVFISWLGGCQSVKKNNWDILKGLNLLFWPDSDSQKDKNGELFPLRKQPGSKAMLKIISLIGVNCRIVKNTKDKIDGWDISDACNEGWAKDDVLNYINNNTVDYINYF